jgi:hypothetical protein
MGHRVHGEVDVDEVGIVTHGLAFLGAMPLQKEEVDAGHLLRRQETPILLRQPQEKWNIG